MAAQAYKVTIIKQKGSKRCRMSSERDEPVMHILSECSKLVQTEYKKHHDKVAIVVRWELCSKYCVKPAKHWYEHRAEEIMENQDTKILSDFNIRTNRVIKARRRDIVKRSSFMWPGDLCQGQGGWRYIEIPISCIESISIVEYKN